MFMMFDPHCITNIVLHANASINNNNNNNNKAFD